MGCQIFLALTFSAAAVLVTAGPVEAQHQRMAFGQQTIRVLGGGGTRRVPAYCLDRRLGRPDAATQLNSVLGAASSLAIIRGKRVPLAVALQRGDVSVRGTSTFDVEFINKTDNEIVIEIASGTVLSEPDRDLTDVPAGLLQGLPANHDTAAQLDLWTNLHQIPTTVIVVAYGSERMVTMIDGSRTVDRVVSREESVGETIAELTRGRRSVAVVTTGLSPEASRAVMADLRLRVAEDGVRTNGFVGGVAYLAGMLPVTRASRGTTNVLRGRTFETNLELQTASAEVIAVSVVDFRQVVATSAIGQIQIAIRDGIEAALGHGDAHNCVSDVAMDISDAVSAEIDELRITFSDMPAADVWMELRDDITNLHIVIIERSEDSSWT